MAWQLRGRICCEEAEGKKTADAADSVNASCGGTETLQTESGHWHRVSSFGSGVGQRIFSSWLHHPI